MTTSCGLKIFDINNEKKRDCVQILRIQRGVFNCCVHIIYTCRTENNENKPKSEITSRLWLQILISHFANCNNDKLWCGKLSCRLAHWKRPQFLYSNVDYKGLRVQLSFRLCPEDNEISCKFYIRTWSKFYLQFSSGSHPWWKGGIERRTSATHW